MNWKRRLWRATLALLGLFALTVGWAVVERYEALRVGHKRLAAACAEADRLDPGWRWDDIEARRSAAAPTPDKNGAILINELRPLLPDGWFDFMADPKSDYSQALAITPDNTHWPAAVEETHRERTVVLAPAIAHVRQFLDRPGGHRPLVLEPDFFSSSVADTQRTRAASLLLSLDTNEALRVNDPVRAVEDVHALLNASRSIGEEPGIVCQMIRMAVRTVSAGLLERCLGMSEPRAGLAELQAAMEREGRVSLLAFGLRGERAGVYYFLTNAEAGIVPLDPKAKPTWYEQPRIWHSRARIPDINATILEYMTAAIEVAKQPSPEWANRLARIELPPDDEDHSDVRRLMADVSRVADGDLRAMSKLRSAAVALACERYRQRTGRWPAALSDIPKNLLVDPPSDPYTGESLRYRLLPDGATVYACGPDRTDNDGQLIDGSRLIPGFDVGFRLWNPDHRRLPPPAEVAPEPRDVLP